MNTARHAPREPISIMLPHALSPIVLPDGWTLAERRDVLILVAPEQDLQITFVVMEKTGEIHEIAAAAWRLMDPVLELAIVRNTEAPSTSGWDLSAEIVYRTAAIESRVALAMVRTLDNYAYANLITGTKAGFSRREAQIAELFDAWQPQGLIADNLAARTAAMWGSQQSEELAQFIRDAMHRMHIPGSAIAIVQGDSVVHAAGFGMRSIDNAQPVAADTRFMIGSTTKPLTTLMMARLIEHGYFSWSTPVTEILPDFALADPDMTHQLQMRHTVAACTGMPRRDVDLVFKFMGVSPERRLAEMKQMQPTTAFGEVFQYSNYLVAAGGYAAARSFAPDGSLASAYQLAMQQLVFNPLGMTNSTLLPQDAGMSAAAAPHAIDFNGNATTIDPVMERFADAVAPAGAVWSTVLDMAQYLMLELNGGIDASGRPLLATSLLEGRRQGDMKIDGNTRYGLGLVCGVEQGLEVISHGGGTSGFSSDMYFLPARKIGVVLLTNLRGAHAFLAAVRQKIMEILFDAKPTSTQMITAAAKALEASTTSIRNRVKIDPEAVAWLDDLQGQYHSEELGSALLTRRDGQYWVQFEAWGSALGSETQTDGNRFVVLTSPPWIGLRLQVADDGRELHLDGGQTKYTFRKR